MNAPLFIFLGVLLVVSCQEFIWDPFTGSLPSDAIQFGNIFIGQAYHQNGIVAGPFKRGDTQLLTPYYNYVNISNVLCGSISSYTWVDTTTATFENDTYRRTLVPIGYWIDETANIFLGRFLMGTEYEYGSIDEKNYVLYYSWYNTTQHQNAYEVLLSKL